MTTIYCDEHISSPKAFDYQESMASPAQSADGLDVTASMNAKRKLHYIAEEKLSEFDVVPKDRIFIEVPPPPVQIIPTSSLIEIFQGVVNFVSETSMDVTLRAKKDLSIPDHSMNIELKFVPPQDLELVKSGSVFYLTLFRETTGRTVRNIEEIRFRRQPDWNRTMLERLKQLSEQL